MFYVVMKENGKVKSKLYFDWEEFYRDTLSTDVEVLGFASYIVRGKTYEQKKECVRGIVFDTQTLINHAQDASYGELCEINSWIERQAKRFGLLKEFKVNGII